LGSLIVSLYLSDFAARQEVEVWIADCWLDRVG